MIEIGSSPIITCTPPKELRGVAVKWFLIDGQNKSTEITTGKEATLKKDNEKNNVELYNISGSWKGMFLHTYMIKSIFTHV